MNERPTPEQLGLMLADAEPLLRALVRREAGVALLRFESEEDLAAGAMQEAIRSLDRLQWQGEPAFRGWLAQIARRHLSGRREYWFACKRHPGALLRLSVSGLGGERLERRELADSAAGPRTFAFRREQLLLAVRALAMLLPRDKDLITWTTEDVPLTVQAERLGITPQAAERARSRAIERLRKAFAVLEGRRGDAGAGAPQDR
ncbi:MAG: hypothetical protein IPJ41_02415 [Phycisphaerales bacterium]|nr:hypothetical protein [Phycisphaerales bacterium]